MIQKALTTLSQEAKDPRYFQILFLGSFLLYGLSYLGWEADTLSYVTIFMVCIVTQLVFTAFTTRQYSSIKSALVTALGLSLLLKTGSHYTAALGALVAISTKFLIKSNNKHIFNPANIGIIVAILLTGDAWVSPGQWGSSVLFWFFVGAAGLMMITKVGRMDTSFTFLVTFGSLLFARKVLYLGWEPSVWLHQMSNGTLLLFTFFMITDPMTTPNHPKARVLWSMILATLLFVASSFLYIQTAAVWILFALSPFTAWFDKVFIAQKYEWESTAISTSNMNNTTIK